jgi:ferrous iron transport protein A
MTDLSRVDQGLEVTLVRIGGGRGLRSKLYSMGLVPGSALTVLSRGGGGPVVLRVKGASLAIGQGMAQKIFVA